MPNAAAILKAGNADGTYFPFSTARMVRRRTPTRSVRFRRGTVLIEVLKRLHGTNVRYSEHYVMHIWLLFV